MRLQIAKLECRKLLEHEMELDISLQKLHCRKNLTGTWSWLSEWCIGIQSWLRGFDAQLGHLHDACTSLPQKS